MPRTLKLYAKHLFTHSWQTKIITVAKRWWQNSNTPHTHTHTHFNLEMLPISGAFTFYPLAISNNNKDHKRNTGHSPAKSTVTHTSSQMNIIQTHSLSLSQRLHTDLSIQRALRAPNRGEAGVGGCLGGGSTRAGQVKNKREAHRAEGKKLGDFFPLVLKWKHVCKAYPQRVGAFHLKTT